eukprot:scaffold1598_cov37-Cyclotella_meneghiniana.AAC.1
MAALVTRVFPADIIGFHYFRAKALKKLSKMTPEEREFERKMNSVRGTLAWNVSVTKNALDRMLSGNEKKGDKEIVLRHHRARECLLWHIIRTEGDAEDGDILACSLLSAAELKKLKEGSQSFKTTVAWSLLKHMVANGEAWPSIKNLKALPSDHVLSCLATTSHYKVKLAWQIVRRMEANREPLLTIKQLENLPCDDPLRILSKLKGYKDKLKEIESRKPIDQVATNEKIRAAMKKLSEENPELMGKINASKAMRKISASKLTVTEQRIALKKQREANLKYV